MTAPVAFLVTVAAGLALAEINRWAPWVAKKIVESAADRFDEPRRSIEREACRANVDTFKTPISQLAYAFYTYFKAPYRAREQRAKSNPRRRRAHLSFLGSAMPAQSFVFGMAIGGLGVTGTAEAAGVGGLAIAAFGGALAAGYRTRRSSLQASLYREPHDRSVMRQLVAIGLGSAALLAAGGAEVLPVFAVPPFVEAVILSLAVGSVSVYASSLVDWYYIVPSISGLTGEAPCERPDPPRWRTITRLWFLHRAIAACGVIAAAVTVPAYAAVASGTPFLRAVWASAAVALLAGLAIAQRDIATAFRYALSSPVNVGDVVRLRGAKGREAYVVDVSAFVIKYRFLDEGTSGVVHSATGDEVLPLRRVPETLTRCAPLSGPCELAGRCRTVNPYCNRSKGSDQKPL